MHFYGVLFISGLILTPLGFFLAWHHGRLVLDLFDLWQADHGLLEVVGFTSDVAGFVMMVVGPLTLVGGIVSFRRWPGAEPKPEPAALATIKPRFRCLGFIVGGAVGAVMGFIYALMNVVPGSAAGLEGMAYFIAPIEGAVVGIVATWLGNAWLFPER